MSPQINVRMPDEIIVTGWRMKLVQVVERVISARHPHPCVLVLTFDGRAWRVLEATNAQVVALPPKENQQDLSRG